MPTTPPPNDPCPYSTGISRDTVPPSLFPALQGQRPGKPLPFPTTPRMPASPQSQSRVEGAPAAFHLAKFGALFLLRNRIPGASLNMLHSFIYSFIHKYIKCLPSAWHCARYHGKVQMRPRC